MAMPAMPAGTDDDGTAASFASAISSRFDVVCFDLDQCLIAQHSRGRLLRSDLPSFVASVSPDFVRAIPALLRRSVQLAVVTHSDLAQHCPQKPRGGGGGGGGGGTREDNPNSVVVLGDDLVHEVLRRVVPQHAHEFFVVAWRPKSRSTGGECDSGKRRHMRTVAAFYGVKIERCVLFDDDPTNCALTDVAGGRFAAYRSNPERGFRFSDLDDDGSDDDDDGGTQTTAMGAASSSSMGYFRPLPDGKFDRLGRWEAKWNDEYGGRPRFHLDGVNPNLERWYGREFSPPMEDGPILVPLCGKAVDLKWLSDAGHACVCGVEGVRRAVEELRDEMLPTLRECRVSNGRDEGTTTSVWTTDDSEARWFHRSEGEDCASVGEPRSSVISVVCADFFELSPSLFTGRGDSQPPFAAVYDRGAIVAVPPCSRPDYVDTIDCLLRPGGQILLVGLDPDKDEGPPFAVTPGVVDELFSSNGYTVHLLDQHEGDFGGGSTEYVFLITKPK